MTEDDKTFRLQIRFNKAEFADLYDDLKQYPEGSLQSGRLRLLVRLGLTIAKGGLPLPAATIGSTAPTASTNPNPDIESFMSRGFDIAGFSFGQAKP